MKYTTTKWTQSNYQIELVVSQEEISKNKTKVLKNFQKDMSLQWFRKGNVPLELVEKNVNQAYILLAMHEEVIHQGTLLVVQENEGIKFIWNIYDLQQEEKDGNTVFSYKLDVYPEVDIKNENWSSVTMDTIDDTPTDEELENTMANLQKQYADYQPHDIIEEDTVSKISFQLLDTSWNELEKGSLFIGKEDFDEFAILKQMYLWKKTNDEIKNDYVHEDLPPMLQSREEDNQENSVSIVSKIEDIRKVHLPERNEESIKKIFWNDEVKTVEELRTKISEVISTQKRESLLTTWVESYLAKTQDSFEIVLPKTLVEEEFSSRIESLKERFWWDEWLTQYYEKIWEEEKVKMHGEIKTAAKTSLEKFFLLRTLVEKLGLDIQEEDWKKPLKVEETLYEKLKG